MDLLLMGVGSVQPEMRQPGKMEAARCFYARNYYVRCNLGRRKKSSTRRYDSMLGTIVCSLDSN